MIARCKIACLTDVAVMSWWKQNRVLNRSTGLFKFVLRIVLPPFLTVDLSSVSAV